MKNDKNVTISDIAAAAGVSKTTVSRYLNNRFDLMSEETRSRIQSVIRVSGYRPSDIARSLKNRRSMLVGVVISDISSPFSSALILGVTNVLGRSGYVPIFVSCEDDKQKEEEFITFLLARAVDGLIINTVSSQNPFLINIANQGLPVVLCDRYVEDYKFDIVTGDYRESMREMLGHLAQQGFARAALFTQTHWEHNSPRYLRREGFLAGMEEYFGVRDAQDLIYVVDPDDETSAVRQLEQLMARCAPGEVPAVIGVNSVTTIHVLHAIRELGLRVPDEIGVCGPDDWSWTRQMNWPDLVTPGISTFVVHAYDIGVKVAELLLERIANPELPKQERIIPCELEPRGSTLLRRG